MIHLDDSEINPNSASMNMMVDLLMDDTFGNMSSGEMRNLTFDNDTMDFTFYGMERMIGILFNLKKNLKVDYYMCENFCFRNYSLSYDESKYGWCNFTEQYCQYRYNLPICILPYYVNHYWIYFVIGASLLVIAIILIIIVVGKKLRRKNIIYVGNEVNTPKNRPQIQIVPVYVRTNN